MKIVTAQHEHTWITPVLAVGCGVWSLRDIEQLKFERITHVIDCREEDWSHLYEGSGIKLHRCPIDDEGSPRPEKWFLSGTDWTWEARAEDAEDDFTHNPRFLVHCEMGTNRGPAMAYAVLREWGWDCEEAEAAIRKRDVGSRFMRYAADYEKMINNE